MKKIVLISDTHSYLGEDVKKYFDDCDEIWHAGDLGSMELLDQLKETGKLTRVVYGNIDKPEIRHATAHNEEFECEGLRVFMTHIGGYPGKYTKRVGAILRSNPPDLYICGHSHILKVMPDKKLDILHMNPGACGVSGFHSFRTFLIFDIIDGEVKNLNAVDLGHKSEAGFIAEEE